MCFYDQIIWGCGYWDWVNLRKHCRKESFTGEKCELRLVHGSYHVTAKCRLCEQIGRKQRRLAKLLANFLRWQQQRKYPVAVENSQREMAELRRALRGLLERHRRGEFNKAVHEQPV